MAPPLFLGQNWSTALRLWIVFHSEVVTYKPTEYGKPVQGKLIIQTEELQISMQLWGLFQRSQSDSFVFGDGVCWERTLTGFGLK